MKTNVTLARLLQEMPALTTDLEGRLQGGFCAFCDMDSCENVDKYNPDCNCNCKAKAKSKKKSRPTNPDCNCNCVCKSNDSCRRKTQTGFSLVF